MHSVPRQQQRRRQQHSHRLFSVASMLGWHSGEIDGQWWQMDALFHPEFMQHFEVCLLRSHAYNEYTRLFEGELIRLCMRTSHGDIDLRPFWPLLFNRQAGLDGSHDWGQTHVCIAFTKRPLHELVATGELFRAKPPWAGLASGLCQRTLCEKLRTDPPIATLTHPPIATLTHLA